MHPHTLVQRGTNNYQLHLLRLSTLGVVVLYVLINYLTASRSPTIWQDEVMFADPAVSFVKGEGFTTSIWQHQPSDAPFAGNSPLHSLLLIPWLYVFGVSPTGVRSINFLFLALSTLMLVQAVRRERGFRHWFAAPTMATLMVTGFGITFSARSGRYDMVGFLVLAGLVYLATRHRDWQRTLWIVLIASLLPWAGLQLLPYAAIVGACVLIFAQEKRHRTAVLWTGAGIVLGGLTLLGFFYALGQLDTFLTSVRLEGRLTKPTLSPVQHLLVIFAATIQDFSATLLFGLVMAGTLRARRLENRGALRLLLGAGAIWLTVPAALTLLGKFPQYYGWMIYVPLVIAATVYLDTTWSTRRRGMRWTVAFVLLITAGIGLPARLAVTLAQWQQRDYRPVQRFVGEHVQASDHVFIDWAAYYPARMKAARVYSIKYLFGRMTGAERAATNVMIISERRFGTFTRRLGAEGWTVVGRLNPPAPRSQVSGELAAPYELVVYRR